MKPLGRLVSAIFGSSILWGSLASFGFYGLIHTQTLSDPFFQRYFAGHWVCYAETIMFFVGASALLLKAFDIADQRSRLGRPVLPTATEPVSAEQAGPLLTQLTESLAKDLQSYLPRRVREALESIQRKRSAAHLNEELRYLSELDQTRAYESYALVRILIWAIPILGFLGTVIGITLAIASLTPEALERSLSLVTVGLGTAFDTTALALSLSMGLMFAQFFVDRMEGRLLSIVDERAAQQLEGRFVVEATGDATSKSVDALSDAVLERVTQLVDRQAQVWQGTIDAAHGRWNELTTHNGQVLEQALTRALARTMQAHADHLTTVEQDAAKFNRRHWARIAKTLRASAAATEHQQAELVRQGELLSQVIGATGELKQLETTLNENLTTLANAQHLQETLTSLSATIGLLNARLGKVAPAATTIEFKDPRANKQAA